MKMTMREKLLVRPLVHFEKVLLLPLKVDQFCMLKTILFYLRKSALPQL